MMYIGLPDFSVDDDAILENLSKNRKLGSYGKLSSYVVSIQRQYKQYKQALGDPWKLNSPLDIPASLADSLINHYEGEVAGLEFISEIRENFRNDSCPMCGSLLPPSEVDHVIPKQEYPEFSFFSLNLVPACKCNQKKGTRYKGEFSPERVLHPYFDTIMRNRVVCLKFSGKAAKPKMQVEIQPGYVNNESVRFHVDNILRKTLVLRHADNLWGKFSERPRSTLRAFKKVTENIDIKEFNEEMNALIDLNDHRYGTPNNWESMFYYGLLKSPIHLGFVYTRLREGY